MPKITAVTLYKHGLGHFERAGEAGRELTLTLPRRAMDDVLKSLTVIPAAGTTVTGVAFETPDDRNEAARRKPIAIAGATPLSAVLAAFAGYAVCITTAERTLRGTLVGLETETESHLKRGVVAVVSERGLELIPLNAITVLDLDDPRAKDDLAFALAERRRDEERALARISLSNPSTVHVSYIAPAPAWRVSYRVLIDAAEADGGARAVTLQGWGLFDNTLEEDLDGVELTLTAGMPISFRYALHQPNTPERPMLADEPRTVTAPLEFDTMHSAASYSDAEPSVGNAEMIMASRAVAAAAPRMAKVRASGAAIMEAAPTQATSEGRGALFAYTVATPVTVKRGESGMVPIVAVKTRGARDLLFNAAKHPTHPAASVRFSIDTGTTLEHGPAVVLDAGHYGGEAVVPFTAGGEVILAYALELGIHVHLATTQREETVKLGFRDRSVVMDTIVYQTTTYEATSSLPKPETIVIEQAQLGDHTFVTAPLEQSATTARFRLAVPARGTAKLAVTTRHHSQRFQMITGLTGEAVQHYLRDKLLDVSAAETLAKIRAAETEIRTLDADRKALAAEVQAVRMRLDDCRKSLAALTADSEVAQRARFAAQLETHDAALQAHDKRDRELVTAMAAAKARLEASLRALGA